MHYLFLLPLVCCGDSVPGQGTVTYFTGTETDPALRLASAADALPVELLDGHVASQSPPKSLFA